MDHAKFIRFVKGSKRVVNDQPKRIKSLFLALAAGFVMQSEGSPTPRGRDSATKDSGGKGGSRAENKEPKQT